ncbi:MAG: exodeoxyribonuclease VII small subunit [Clostridia bacterium]|nr:exodeoxyribonuclease VII small subunit [Clostridia bacterium]
MAKAKSFEQSINELEEIVSALENGETTLDESLKLFEQGVKLSKSCQTMLDKAQQKVTVLLKNEDGEITEEEFEGLND